MTHLELLEDTFNKIGIKYHKISASDDPEYVYIQKMGAHDTDGHIYVLGHGLVKLTLSTQLIDFFEFYKGELVSW